MDFLVRQRCTRRTRKSIVRLINKPLINSPSRLSFHGVSVPRNSWRVSLRRLDSVMLDSLHPPNTIVNGAMRTMAEKCSELRISEPKNQICRDCHYTAASFFL
ncbi:hypothetical protein Rcae01_00814 [Novipirellula caenicola]|uniref:Uncharacterized protein n=1 Tax=Novipirellula caenicola TaxID=1536901 RepID=A0ABP9VM64_9BACT